MKALITGASSGIGKDMAIYLSKCGFELIVCGRDKSKLEQLQSSLKTKVKVIIIDLADEKKVKDLYMVTKSENVDVVINNAGFGLFGDYNSCDLLTELEMIDVNVKAVHILTRMFLKDMVKKNKGYILNVASSAGLLIMLLRVMLLLLLWLLLRSFVVINLVLKLVFCVRVLLILILIM